MLEIYGVSCNPRLGRDLARRRTSRTTTSIVVVFLIVGLIRSLIRNCGCIFNVLAIMWAPFMIAHYDECRLPGPSKPWRRKPTEGLRHPPLDTASMIHSIKGKINDMPSHGLASSVPRTMLE